MASNQPITVGIICALLASSGCSLRDNSELGAGTPDAGAQAGSGGLGGAGGSGAAGSGGTAGSAGSAGSGASGGTGGSAGGSPRLADGASCNSGSDCESTFCVDGVCCDSACSGTCEACSAAYKADGADGSCGPVAADTDPDAECMDTGPTSCGTSGSCDGAGACAMYPADTQCSDSSCVGNMRTLPRTCDGAGTCQQALVEACSQGCDGDVCLGQCQSDASCQSGYFCNTQTGVCTPKLGPGATCQANQANRCDSGFCVDGYCCDTECGGTCEACSAARKGAGVDGACGPVSLGQDPDSECIDQGAASCGTNGFCNGAGACRLYAVGTECVPSSCQNPSTIIPARTCDGAGTCRTTMAASCGEYVCALGSCTKNCSSDSGCATGYFCDTAISKCVPPLRQGEDCSRDRQCETRMCVDGACCDGPCADECHTCGGGLGAVRGKCSSIECGAVGDECGLGKRCVMGSCGENCF